MFIVRKPTILKDGSTDYWLIGVFPITSAQNLAFAIDEFHDPSDCEFCFMIGGGFTLNEGDNALMGNLQKIYDNEVDDHLPEFTINYISDQFFELFSSPENVLWYSLKEALIHDLDTIEMYDIDQFFEDVNYVEPEEPKPALKVIK